jgi:hypothetical protein
MRQPWITGNESPEALNALYLRQISDLEECNKRYLDDIQRGRALVSRVGADIAALDQQLSDAYRFMAVLTNAVDYMTKFVEQLESPLWDILGDDGLRELKENVCVIERVKEDDSESE